MMHCVLPESSKSAAKLGGRENPMEDRSSFPGCGSGEVDGLRVCRSENCPKCLSSLCPCRLRSVQLHSTHARMFSLSHTHKKCNKNIKLKKNNQVLNGIYSLSEYLHRWNRRGCSSTWHNLSSRRGFGLLLRGGKLLWRGIVISW